METDPQQTVSEEPVQGKEREKMSPCSHRTKLEIMGRTSEVGVQLQQCAG